MFSKVFTALISPLGTAVALLVLGLLLQSLGSVRARDWARRCAWVGTGWLLVWSLPVVSDSLRGWIEGQAGPRTVAGVVAAPVMVVLGGGVAGPRPPERVDPDLGRSADRLWHAARLFKMGKARRVILSGGVVRGGDGSEADAMAEFLADLGVPRSAMVLESGSGNTAENALQTRALLQPEGISEIVLVTSALHMPRARAAFEQAGFTLHPAPTDVEVIAMPFDLLRVLPDAQALEGSGRAFKELAGRWLGR